MRTLTMLLTLATGLAASCNDTTTMIQTAIDNASAQGGGWAAIPCGFHATLPLQLRSGVKIGSAHCIGSDSANETHRLITLGACSHDQDHIISVNAGTNQGISEIIFDLSNLTRPSQAIQDGVGAVGLIIENNKFLNISITKQCTACPQGSQSYHAIGLSGCLGCIVRGNHVPQSGGDALNFNSGEYVVTDNLVENVGDGCIAMNNNAFGVVSNNILRRCNLGIGAGPSGSVDAATNSTPFAISNNVIEDCDYAILMGWFHYQDRVGPMNTVISGNIIRRPRQAGIQYKGDHIDGAMIIQGNQITHSGYPNSQPPGPESGRPIPPGVPGFGRGIFVQSLQDVQVKIDSCA